MKRSFTLLLTFAVALWVTSLSAVAQRKPMSTGIEHAESTASNSGQRGIEKAETKQSVHKHAKKAKGKKAGKKLAKGKSKVKRA
jgi:flagellar motor protein MotB